MQFKGTNQVRETTIYRILGDSTKHVFDFVFRDAFTCTLLGLVVFTNLMVFLVPVSLNLFEFSIAKVICQSASIGLLLGYATLATLLIAKLRKTERASQPDQKANFTMSHAPRLRNAVRGIQCLLFASLICSSFIMKQQLGLINLVDPANYTQQVMSKSGSSLKPMDILPLLNNDE